jgi:hypothetical protein
MADTASRPQRFFLQIGAAIVVTGLVPLGDATASPSNLKEGLAALRAAAQAGQLELLYRADDGTLTRVDPQATFAQSWEKTKDEIAPP